MNGVPDNLRLSLLHHFGVTPDRLVAKGMEAEVYRYDANHVLELYIGTTSLARLRTLQQFYAGLDRSSVSYALPAIDVIVEQQGCLVTLEKRCAGRPMSELLPNLLPTQLEQWMQTYLAASLELQAIRMRHPLHRYKLFDDHGISSAANGDWNQFLISSASLQSN